MNIVLIGYRGTGKTTIGKVLAERLGMRYVGLDAQIVARAGRSIPQIVQEGGWDRFREIEAEVVRTVSALDGCVLDTGGGVILRDENVSNLRRNGLVVLLEAAVEDIVERMGSDTQRPSLTGRKSFVEEVEEVLAERRPRYEAAAEHVIDTSALTEEQVVEQIAAIFRRAEAGQGC